MKTPTLLFVALCVAGTLAAENPPIKNAEADPGAALIQTTLVEAASAPTIYRMQSNDNPHARRSGLASLKTVAGSGEEELRSAGESGPENQPQLIPPQKGMPAIAKAASGIVVSITMLGDDGHPVAQGSGFFVSKDGRVVTNYHVVRNGSSAIVRMRDGAVFVVDGLLAFDEPRDIAVIKAHGEAFHEATLGDSDRIQVGDPVVAIGNPLDSTVSSGIVSGIRTEGGAGKFLEVTAPISPDSSGGPLFDMEGEVVGVTTSSVGVGGKLNFAIPINAAKPLLQADPSKLVNFPVDSPDASKEKTETSRELTAPRSPGSSSSEALIALNLRSEPAGAEIYVDDSFAGKAPIELKLSPGSHAIRLFMDGYQNWVQWIALESGPEVDITATLQKSN